MAFHWKDGWYFERTDKGAVKIFHDTVHQMGDRDLGKCDVSLEIDADSWASIVATVSARGENTATYNEARNLHNCK